MFLNSLKIDNYKNLEKFKLSFNKKINCFIGKNGIGKTNIVDSIYHLAFTKSYFNPSTSQNVKTGSEYFSISGDFKIDDRNYSVLADLTIKGITNPIAFEAEVTGNGNSFVAASKFTIDRTKWGVEYKSGNIFKNLGDKIIYDDIEFDVFLISNK